MVTTIMDSRIKTAVYPQWGQGQEIVNQLQWKWMSSLLRCPYSPAWTFYLRVTILLFTCVKRESKVHACCSKRWQNLQCLWEGWFYCFLVSQLIHNCQGQVPRPAPPVFSLPSILIIVRLDFCLPEKWWRKDNISFCCNLSKEWETLQRVGGQNCSLLFLFTY